MWLFANDRHRRGRWKNSGIFTKGKGGEGGQRALTVLREGKSEKKMKKMKNDLRAMKQILYDMGLLTYVRWPLYRASKVQHTLWTKIEAEMVLPIKNYYDL